MKTAAVGSMDVMHLLPPPSPYHPPRSSQCTSPKHPVSFIEPELATLFIYDIIYVSMPFSKITADGDCSYEIKRCLLLGRKVTTNLDSILKSRDITLPTKVRLVKAMVFPYCHVWMWELDCEESWVPKNWCFRTVVLEKTLESPLDCKEIQPVHLKGNQS